MTRTLVAVSAVWFAAPPAAAGELALDAKALFGRSVARDVRLTADGSAVELESGELVEDDGPAAGYSYRPNEEKLSDRVWAKKELVVPDPRARAATLLVGPGGVGLKATVNGREVDLPAARKAGGYWDSYPLPAGVLKAGTNEIVVRGGGKVWIARAEDFAAGSTDRPKHPGRSARSDDGGATWNPDRLGPAGDVRGEYCVRLFLDRHRGGGSLTLPVLDTGNLAGRVVAPPAAGGPVRVNLAAEAGPSGRVAARVRTGPAPTPDAKTWSDWQPLDPTGGEVRGPRGRYLQVVVELHTTDPLSTPRVKGVRVEAPAPGGDDWAAKLRAVEVHNEEIVRTAVPFRYEPFDHPRLKELRARHKLDEVVKGAKTEFELVGRLARWSAGRWGRGHLKDAYPPWDALEILKPHADGTPVGGFCQQFNVVFLQACESFGIPGRAVSVGPGDHGGAIKGGGHEVVELWSNQFKKWVYVDGDTGWHAVDATSDVPLSLWELRRRQLLALGKKPFDPIRVVEPADAKRRWPGLTDWPPFLELRLIPRSDFLERPAPLPLNQGMRGWFWTGHHAWTDAAHPASLLYGHRVADRRNWEWTLNQARVTLEATGTPGEVRVHLDTETPGFDTFLAATDGRAAERVASGFVWKLHPGKNHLAVRPRNVLGREGIASRVTLDAP